jgi:hypothetical protein
MIMLRPLFRAEILKSGVLLGVASSEVAGQLGDVSICRWLPPTWIGYTVCYDGGIWELSYTI